MQPEIGLSGLGMRECYGILLTDQGLRAFDKVIQVRKNPL